MLLSSSLSWGWSWGCGQFGLVSRAKWSPQALLLFHGLFLYHHRPFTMPWVMCLNALLNNCLLHCHWWLLEQFAYILHVNLESSYPFMFFCLQPGSQRPRCFLSHVVACLSWVSGRGKKAWPVKIDPHNCESGGDKNAETCSRKIEMIILATFLFSFFVFIWPPPNTQMPGSPLQEWKTEG